MDLQRFVEKATPLRALNVRISQNGELIAKYDWEGEWRRNVYSVSKSVTALAVGLALEEGLLRLDEKLVDVFREELPKQVGKNLEKATIRELLTMCLGQQEGSLMGMQRPQYEEEDWVKLSLSIPFEYEPGTKFIYNNVGPYLAGILVQRRSGCNLVDYLMPRLFTPLGIKRPTWEVDPMGNTFGAGGLFLTVSEMHKIGLLCLQKGKWKENQLISDKWIFECTQKQVKNGSDGYGYLFWRGAKNSYRMDGKFGQFSIVIPEKKAVISTVAECRQEDDLRRTVFDEIYPQL